MSTLSHPLPHFIKDLVECWIMGLRSRPCD